MVVISIPGFSGRCEGSGTALAWPPDGEGEPFSLGAGSMLWLSACDGLTAPAAA